MMPWLGRGYVDARSAQEVTQQTRLFCRWRPWMWGPLRRFWCYEYEAAGIGAWWGPSSYRWMSRRERREPMCPGMGDDHG